MYYEVERIFMDIVEEKRIAKRMTQRAVARSTWPEMGDAERRYRFLTKGSSPTGKPLRLGLSECLGLAAAVGEDATHMIWEANARLVARQGERPIHQRGSDEMIH